MAETRLVPDHREQLWCFSLKTGSDEGLTAGQADAVARWRKTMTGIAIEEMPHLALVMNVMTAIGAAPAPSRPNFPRHSEYRPPGGGVRAAAVRRRLPRHDHGQEKGTP